MFKIKNIKIVLLVAIVLLGMNMSFGQVVTVPAPCVVVDPGTGGSIALNTVGNGGVVRMADNYAGGSFTTTVPAGYSQGAWSLKGDLSVTTNTFHNAVIQPAGTLSTYSIQSYNKFRRPTEGLFNSAAAKLAKSKGTVRISYINGPCNGVGMSFEVYKTYATVSAPAIVGPTCIGINIPATFSVDRVASDNTGDNIGFDEYYWSFVDAAGVTVPAPPMTEIYYSADNSSFSFKPTTSASFIIKCAMGKANSVPWSTLANIGPNPSTGFTYPTFVTKVVGALPTQPTITSTQLSQTPYQGNFICVNTGLNPLVLTYPSPPSGTTYTWSTTSNWNLSVSNSFPTSTLTIALDNNSGELKLRVQNSCTSIDFTYGFRRTFTSAVAINGASCITPNVASVFDLGTGAAVNATAWTVTVPPSVTPVSGFTINTNSLTTTATITASSSVPPGQYTLNCKSTGFSYNGNSCQGTITKIINVKPNTPTITAADGNACVPKNSTASKTFNCQASAGASYVWVFPAGWNATSFTTTANSIIVTPASSSAVLDGTVTVTVGNIVGCNAQATFAIGYTATAPTGVAASCWSTGVLGVHRVTFTNPLPGTYNATLSLPGIGNPNLITGAVTFTAPNILTFSTSNILTAGQQYDITITHNAINGCTPASASSTTLLTVTAGGTVTSPTVVSSSSDVYQGFGGSAFAWYINGNFVPSPTNTPTLNCNGSVLQLSGNNAIPTSIYVLISNGPNTCVTKADANLTFATHSSNRQPVKTGGIKDIIDEITIYPNPNNGIFTIKLDKVRLFATATLNDTTGKEIATYILKKGDNKIEQEGLASGTYSIILEVDGKTETRQIIIK